MLTLLEYPLNEAVSRFFSEAEQSGFQQRSGQLAMADEVSTAIAGKKSLAVEAGVGIGKSFAYLVPALIQYFRERRQIVIATSTIALQEQLEKDAHTILKMLGVTAPVILAKGMKHYACMQRVSQQYRKHPDSVFLEQLMKHVSSGRQDKAQISLNISNTEWQKTANYHFGGPLCQNCGYSGDCVYRSLRLRLADKNDIVICNQNMLVAHFMNAPKHIFSRNIGTIIVDEAHNLEDVFRDAFTESYSKNEMLQAVKICAAVSRTRNSGRIAEALQSDILHLFRIFKGQIKAQQTSGTESASYFMQPTKNVHSLMRNIRKNAAALENTDELSELYFFLHKATSEADKHIIWLEKKPDIRLCVCRKNLQEKIAGMLYQQDHAVILTSATLSSGYYLNTIGFPSAGIIAESKPSPFDYQHRTIMYCSTALPYPTPENRSEYQKAAIPEIIKLLQITEGKSLILFTAKQDMNEIYKRLSNMDLPYKIIRQSPASSQEYQLKRFRIDTNSVILGTGAYWEGISIEGESLSQVIIFRLPFPVPDPILDYKMSLAENGIAEVAVPEMLMKPRQGTGRLIRSDRDVGIISILDPRISSRSKSDYAEMTRKSLPFPNVTEDMEEVRAFWDRLYPKGGLV